MFLKLQNQILEMVARGAPLRETAWRICLEAERLAPDCICSIVAVDEERRLRPLAAPSLPTSYREAVDGVRIGPAVGSCGTAAERREPVTVVDIAADPLWADYRHLALPLGLRACWSNPIFGSDGRTAGAFAFYYREARGPTEDEKRIVATCLDLCAIAIERAGREARIEHLAYMDGLTGLGNRASFDRDLAGTPTQGALGLLMIDVDRLKLVNDTLGHAAGDDLLREVGVRVAAAASPGSAYRLGGDEFAVVVRGPDAAEMLPWTADRLIEAMRAPIRCAGRPMQAMMTIGGATLGPDCDSVAGLRHKADLALYHAKEEQPGGFARFRPGLASAMTRRFDAVRSVQGALDEDRVAVHYQPIVRLDGGEIIGVEALARVMGPDGARLDEAAFQLAMSDPATAAQLTERVLTKAAGAIRAWLDAGIPFQHMGVNVSAGDFESGGLEAQITEAFERFGVPLRHVILEVTELVYLGANDRRVAEAVKSLRSRGLRVALDDFGTGYASLTHLLTFPVDVVKIDRSFVASLGPDGPSSIIVGGLIDIARKLGMRVVAEGVETARQAELLRGLGCRLGQGYHYARPADFATTTERLHARAQRGSLDAA